MRVAFIGSSKFGLRCLDALFGLPGCEVVGAVTAPRSFSISYAPQGVTNVLHADVTDFCRSNGVPVSTISDGMRGAALLESVQAWRPDAFLVSGWYHMIPKTWLDLAPAYGLHASLLPDYSGGAPLTWAIINGERKTGITLFQMASGVDNGPIVGQAQTPIEPEDTIATLYARIEELGLSLIRTHLPRLARGTAVLTQQDERRRRVFPQRTPADGLIDWSQTARRIHDFVRAQTRPYPGAFTLKEGTKLTIWSSKVAENFSCDLAEGEFKVIDGRTYAGCGSGTILELVDMETCACPARLWEDVS